jgi:hypothetical protein
LLKNSYGMTHRNIGGIISLNKSNLIVLKLTILRKRSNICRFVIIYTKFGRLITKRLYSVILLSDFNKISTSALIYKPLTNSMLLIYLTTLLASAFVIQVTYLSSFTKLAFISYKGITS